MTGLSEGTSSRRPDGGMPGEHEHPLVAAARRIGAVLRQTAEEGERERRLPTAAAEALAEADFFRLCRPRHLGGLEADPLTVLASIEELARHDGSAAWCALNSGIAGALHSFLPHEGARETGSHDTVVNGVFAPSGRAIARDGGYLVNGRWSFVSNCHQCTWLALTSIVFNGDEMSMTPDGPEIVVTFIEAGDWQIIDTWDTVGLRATGSHDVEVFDVFVPAHRTFPLPLPDPVSDGALFRFPLVGLFSVGIAACALGIAHAAIDDVLDLADTKTPFGLTAPLASRTQHDNEQWHMLVMEELVARHGRRLKPVRHRLLPRLMALPWQVGTWVLHLVRPDASYQLNAAFEAHAECCYMRYVVEHPETERQVFGGPLADRWSVPVTVADVLRQIGHDERVHRLDSEQAARDEAAGASADPDPGSAAMLEAA